MAHRAYSSTRNRCCLLISSEQAPCLCSAPSNDKTVDRQGAGKEVKGKGARGAERSARHRPFVGGRNEVTRLWGANETFNHRHSQGCAMQPLSAELTPGANRKGSLTLQSRAFAHGEPDGVGFEMEFTQTQRRSTALERPCYKLPLKPYSSIDIRIGAQCSF